MKIFISTIISLLLFASTSHAGNRCTAFLSSLSFKKLGAIVYAKNPIPSLGQEKLFSPDSLDVFTSAMNDPQGGRIIEGRIEEIQRKVIKYIRKLYRWGFITKVEMDNNIFTAKMSAQLSPSEPKVVTKNGQTQNILEAANLYYPQNSEELLQKKWQDATVDDFFAALDPNWHKIDHKIRLSSKIPVIHPGWIMAGKGMQAIGKLVVAGVIFSVAFGVVESVNSYYKDPKIAETRRLSYYTPLYLDNQAISEIPNDMRVKLLDLYRRSNGVITSLEQEARFDLIYGQVFLASTQSALVQAAYQMKNPELVRLHLKALYDFELLIPDWRTHPLGKSIQGIIDELFQVFDPDGKIRAEFRSIDAQNQTSSK